ncbi:MAG: hypothetical protein KQH53_09430 [Desulfarculaceae bacterium]|nr:hypothetical protein [Desulfarculaceae bacterium]
MDNKTLNALQDRARRLGRELEALSREAGDFPAMTRNTERIRASLAMICMGLGLTASGEPVETQPED